MRKTNRKIRLLFAFSLLLSVALPAGILGVVFGAKEKLVWLLVLGIVGIIGGFYIMPLLWVAYGGKLQDRRLLRMIEQEHIYTVGGLAQQTGYAEKTVREKIKKLILSRELTGYLLVKDTLELNGNVKQTEPARRTRKCENCGAMMRFNGVKFVCEYCGSVQADVNNDTI